MRVVWLKLGVGSRARRVPRSQMGKVKRMLGPTERAMRRKRAPQRRRVVGVEVRWRVRRPRGKRR